jgi:hypothetical protein
MSPVRPVTHAVRLRMPVMGVMTFLHANGPRMLLLNLQCFLVCGHRSPHSRRFSSSGMLAQ